MATGKAVNRICLILWGVVVMTAGVSSWGDLVTADAAAASALNTFAALRISGARVTGTTTHLVYRPGRETALDTGQIELLPTGHIVLISGNQKRRDRVTHFSSTASIVQETLDAINAAHRTYEESGGDRYTAAHYESVFGLPQGVLKKERSTRWVEEEGIVGFVRTAPITGTAYEVTSFWKALPHLTSLAIDATQARAVIEAAGAANLGEPKLVEVSPYVFAWQCESPGATHYVDAKTGGYLSETTMGETIRQHYSAEAAMAKCGAAGSDPRHFTLAPVFAEQGMHQWQEQYAPPRGPVTAALCGPTSLAMLFDYWGEGIPHTDVADVANRKQKGFGSSFSDLMRAAMFSHTSTGNWDHLEDGVTGPGYAQRSSEDKRYGYTVAFGGMAAGEGEGEGEWEGGSFNAWMSLKNLTQDHCPFLVHVTYIDPNDPENIATHYCVLLGYADDGGDGHRWVWFADPVWPDFQYAAVQMMRWYVPEPDYSTCWVYRWAESEYPALVARPMPVSLEFLPGVPQAGQFTIRATVRTCQKHPLTGGSWSYVNLADVENQSNWHLWGGDVESGFAYGLPITITCSEPSVNKVSGANPWTWYPTTPDAETQGAARPEWIFTADGNERGAEFKVVATGWTAGFWSAQYVGFAHLASGITAQADELTLVDAATTLAADLAKDATSMLVSDGSGFALSCPFYVTVDGTTANTEVITVSAQTGNSFTSLGRGAKFTKGVFHAQGASVELDRGLGYAPHYIMVDGGTAQEEVMAVTQRNGATLSVDRAKRGTTAQAHAAGASVHLYNADELFGWDVLRIDSKLTRIRNSSGETVAAFGDQGNLYLKRRLFEWQPADAVVPRDNEREVLVYNSLVGATVARIDSAGNLYTRAGVHCGMDDLYDTCDTASPCSPEASEQYYLDNPNPPVPAVKVVGPAGTVAHIDAGWRTLPGEGEAEEIPDPGLFGGNIRLRGHVFQDWDHWDYWDASGG